MSRRSAVELARAAFGLTYLGGAVVHLVYWASNRAVYGELTEFVLFDWYRDLWTDLVLPNLGLLLPVLAAFELLLGVGVLSRGRIARVALAVGALFNVALAPLGFWWPSNVALAAAQAALLRYEYAETSLARLRGWRLRDAAPRPR
ncbi:MAG: hypothetical protein ABEJ23_08745 [Haloarculaceae archaeon]